MPWSSGDSLNSTNLNNTSGLVYNVKDADYGATGDGTTDDTSAISLAVDAAEAAGTGATVYFPPGNYSLSSWPTVTTNHIAFVGAGGGGKTANQGTRLTYSGSGTSFVRFVNLRGVRFENIHVTGDSKCSLGMVLEGITEGYFKNVGVRSFTSEGWRLDTDPSQSGSYNYFVNCSGVAINNSDLRGAGLSMNEKDAKACNGNTFVAFNGATSDIALLQTSSCNENTFIACSLSNASTGAVVEGRSTSFIGCDMEGNDDSGISIPAGNTTATVHLSGVLLQSNGTNIWNPDNRPVYGESGSQGVFVDDAEALSGSGTVQPDPRRGIHKTATLTGDLSIGNPNPAGQTGQSMVFLLTQDGTGGHTTKFTGNTYRVSSSITALLATDADAVNTVTVWFDGTSWIATSFTTGL